MKRTEETTSGSPEKRTAQYLPKPAYSPMKGENNESAANDETRRLSDYDLSLSDNEGDATVYNQEQISKALLAQKNLPLKDKIMMGPLDKYQKYNRFPWKMIVHLLLILTTTTQVFLLNYSEGQHYRTHQIVFYNLFFQGEDYTDLNMERYRHIFQLADDKGPATNQVIRKSYMKNKRMRQGPEPEPNPDDFPDGESLIEVVQRSVLNYYKLTGTEESMLDQYVPMNYSNPNCFQFNQTKLSRPDICPVQLDIQYLKEAHTNATNLSRSISIDDFWIFNATRIDELKEFIGKVVSFHLTYNVQVTYPHIDSKVNSCFDWTIQQKFDYQNRGIIKQTLNLNQMNCGKISDFVNNPTNAINALVVLILSVFSLGLQLIYINSVSEMYKSIRQKYIDQEKKKNQNPAENYEMSFRRIKTKNQNYINQMTNKVKEKMDDVSKEQAEDIAKTSSTKVKWEDLRFSEKAKLFSYWTIIIVICNILQIIGALMSLVNGPVPLQTIQLFVGLGCALCWFSSSKFIEHSPHLSFFSRTIHHAGPNIIRHGINMVPFFIGFAMLGMAIFWPSFRFRSAYTTFFSLYSIMLGDEISNAFMEVVQFDSFFGPIYMFCWVFLSMSILMNLFIIIVGDSFATVQETHKFNWLTQDEKLIALDKSREFDETSSESTSTDSDENPDLDKYERPLKKKIKSVRALKRIIEADYKDWNGGLIQSINQEEMVENLEMSNDEQQQDTQDQRKIMTRKIKQDMMRISQEGKDEFEMNIEGDLNDNNQDDPKVISGNVTKQEEMLNYIAASDLMTEIHENDEESPSASSEENQEEFNREFTKSFQEKVPAKIKDSFKAISKLKTKLRKEVDRCVTNVTKDISNFSLSVRSSVRTGIVNTGFGDKSVKQTSDTIREELFKIQEKMLQLQTKLQGNNQ